MNHAFLRKIFPEDLHHLDGLREELTRLLLPARCVLDLGCGNNAALASYRTEERHIWGTDFQEHPNLQDREWFRLLGPEGNIPFEDDTFEVVVSIMVLEHLERPRQFFREVARVLRPGGHFVGHTVSGRHYVTWMRRLFGLLPHRVNQQMVHQLYGRAAVDTFPAYYRANDGRQLERESKAAGLQLERLHRYADPSYFHFSPILWNMAVVLDRLFEQLGEGCGRLYLTAVMRKPDVAPNGSLF